MAINYVDNQVRFNEPHSGGKLNRKGKQQQRTGLLGGSVIGRCRHLSSTSSGHWWFGYLGLAKSGEPESKSGSLTGWLNGPKLGAIENRWVFETRKSSPTSNVQKANLRRRRRC